MENEVRYIDTERLVSEIIEQGEAFNDIKEDLLHDFIAGKVSKDTDLVHTSTFSFDAMMADKL